MLKVGETVQVGVMVGLMDQVGVIVGELLKVGEIVHVLVMDHVGVMVGLCVQVRVMVRVREGVAVREKVGERVKVGETLKDAEGSGVLVTVMVRVKVGVLVEVGVAAAIGPANRTRAKDSSETRICSPLDLADTHGLRAFVALLDLKDDVIAFSQNLEARHVDAREVDENVLGLTWARNEAETLLLVKKLDGPLHCNLA